MSNTNKTSSFQHCYAACISLKGVIRSNNEDNFLFAGSFIQQDSGDQAQCFETDFNSEKDMFFAVFDGMGGGDYGEIASYTAAEMAKDFWDDPANINPFDITPTINKMCVKLNDGVFQKGMELGAYQMGTTVVSLYFKAGYVWICNVGDSRAYLLRNGCMSQLSKDHNDMELLKENGITDRKPHITQYLGMNAKEFFISPFVNSCEVLKDDIFILCSDGLTDMVDEETIQYMVTQYGTSPVECAKKLVNQALCNGGEDNITVVCIHAC